MVYPMGYTIPLVPWDGIGMGPRGGAYRPKQIVWYCARTKWTLSLSGLAHYREEFSLPLGLHNIPYLLTWYRYGIRGSDSIPSHGMGPHPYIPYHTIFFRPLVETPKIEVEGAQNGCGRSDSSVLSTFFY